MTHKSALVIAVIGGSGFYQFEEMSEQTEQNIETPFGVVSGVRCGLLHSVKMVFIARHGSGHKTPPHKINYRANIWALKSLGVQAVISVNAVGGINEKAEPSKIIIPDQIIDYTWGREHTFADELSASINHIDFTNPFDKRLRALLVSACKKQAVLAMDHGVYACCQGPRLETAAEVQKLKNDGCDLVGMTLMPEASLAREAGLDYAAACPVVNWAAGLGSNVIELADIERTLLNLIPAVKTAICSAVKNLSDMD